MIRFDVVSLMPELVEPVAACGVTGRARDRGIFQLNCWNPRDYTLDRNRRVDDRPYGGGPGMVIAYQPLADTVDAIRQDARDDCKVIYLSPQGQPARQGMIRALARGQRPVVLVCGRYEGVDERFIEDYVDEEWSLGDFVLSGGEIAAMAVIDATIRLLPGALGDDSSALNESFSEQWLEYPHYTRPEIIAGKRVPEVLLSGDHAEIERWRQQKSEQRTRERRPDLLEDE